MVHVKNALTMPRSHRPSLHHLPARMNFPPELRDLVMDCLRSDAASLRACSLTCKAWLPRARHHLFRFVEIRPGRRGEAFRILLEHTPEIGQYIREVEISAVGEGPAVPDLLGRWPTLLTPGTQPARPNWGFNTLAWLQSVLPKSTTVLARVSSLTLVSFPVNLAFAELLGTYFGRITTVNIDSCRAETFGELLSLPRALTQVQCLRMDGVTWFRPNYPTPNGNILGRPCSLKSLTLTEKVDSATVINWLVEQQRYTMLSSLSCFLSSDPSAIAVQKLLDAIGGSLHELAIGFSDVRDPTGTSSQLEAKRRYSMANEQLSSRTRTFIYDLLQSYRSYTFNVSTPPGSLPHHPFRGFSHYYPRQTRDTSGNSLSPFPVQTLRRTST